MSCPCCQLHVHDRRSFFDGLAPTAELVALAAELKHDAIAITNHGNVYSAPELFKECKKHGIKGIIGMEAYEVVPHTWDPDPEVTKAIFNTPYSEDNPRYHHLTLWVQDLTGWQNMCAIHSQSFTAGFKPKNQPLVDRATLERHSEGIMVGLGCMASRTNWAMARGEDGHAEAAWYKEVYGDRLYVEVMANLPEQVALIRAQRKLAAYLGRPTIATNDVHYLLQEDGVENGPHHTLVKGRYYRSKKTEIVAEATNDKSDSNTNRWYGSDEFYFKSGDEMLATGGFTRDEIERTVEVAARCSFDLTEDVEVPAPPEPIIPATGEDPVFEAWLSANGLAA